tara:strand:+ start:258 stop:1340 length:1083 start_codon:yes stop_codon:yes gene_type:complete
MSLVKNYISKLKTNNFALKDDNSKISFLNHCIDTGTLSFFFGRDNNEIDFAMENQDLKESIISIQKKSLQYQASLRSFLKLARTNNVDVCLLKGAFMSNFMYANFSMRSMRDIDILVDESKFFKIVNIMLENGYFFLNSSKKKFLKFNLYYSHQAPILVNKFGIAFEVHHRLKTQPEFKNSDHLEKNLIKAKKEKMLFGMAVSVPNNNFAFIHCCYHAISKSKLTIGPIFLNDLLQFKNRIDKDILADARKSNCLREVELGISILKYLQGLEIKNTSQVEKAIEIIIHCYKMPEFFPRKKLNLLSSLKDSYAFNSYTFSFGDSSKYMMSKFKQIYTFFKSYILNYNLHKKRKSFFKDFNS